MLHDPRSVATPSQRLAAAEHQARLAKIAANAKATTPEPQAVEVSESVPLSFDEWVLRQEQLNPIPKKQWFSIVSESEAPRPSVESIQKKVAKYYGTSRHDMISARRSGHLITPRHVAMYFCRQLTLRSFPEIGRRFGNRDHTVPMYACNKIEGLIKSDPKIAADVEAIKTLFGSRA